MTRYYTLFLTLLPLFLCADEPAKDAATSSYEFAFIKMLATLAILLVLVFASLWLLRRVSQGRLLQSNQNKSIRILERRALSPKSMLYVVEFSGKQILVAESQLEIRKIDELPPSPST